MPAIKVQEEIFRSMKVESGSKTPYTDATQVSPQIPYSQDLFFNSRFYAVALYCSDQLIVVMRTYRASNAVASEAAKHILMRKFTEFFIFNFAD